jgi:cyclic pyranopterin phosphate synthase
MLDSFSRDIRYLRISVTDKCNLRCTYCMPEEGVTPLAHADLLRLEQIVEIARGAVELGFNKIRLTGGEPLVRKGILSLVEMLHELAGIDFLAMTTNGILLSDLAAPLKAAGLDSLNISLDTLSPDDYSKITRCGSLKSALDGIDAARLAGFEKIKINMVVSETTSPEEISKMAAFCRDNDFKLQKIRRYSLTEHKTDDDAYERPPRCGGCDRLRLTCDGYLKPCLHSDREIKVDFDDIKASITDAVQGKPERGDVCGDRNMMSIGG